MNLPYFAADTLNATLYQIKDRLTASEMHPLMLGPWRVDMRMDVESDVHGAVELGFWVTLEKNLRLYLVVREKESWLFVLDTKALKKAGEKSGFAGHTVPERVVEFKSAIKGVFKWTADSKWTNMEYDGFFVGE